jgi:hypothetical protein
MKFKVINCFVMSGKSKSNGSDYSMSRVTVLQDFEDVDRGTFKRLGVGMSSQELQVSDHFYPELKSYLSANLKAAPVVEADFSIAVNRGELVITGFERGVASGPSAVPKTGTNP